MKTKKPDIGARGTRKKYKNEWDTKHHLMQSRYKAND